MFGNCVFIPLAHKGEIKRDTVKSVLSALSGGCRGLLEEMSISLVLCGCLRCSSLPGGADEAAFLPAYCSDPFVFLGFHRVGKGEKKIGPL